MAKNGIINNRGVPSIENSSVLVNAIKKWDVF